MCAQSNRRSRSSRPNLVPQNARELLIETIETDQQELRIPLFRYLIYEDLISPGTPAIDLPDSKSLDDIITTLRKLDDAVEARGEQCDRGMRLLAIHRKQRMNDMAAQQARAETFPANGAQMAASPGAGLTMPVAAGSPRAFMQMAQSNSVLANRLRDFEAQIRAKNPSIPPEQAHRLASEALAKLIQREPGLHSHQQAAMSAAAGAMAQGPLANGITASTSPHQYAQLLRLQQQQQAAQHQQTQEKAQDGEETTVLSPKSSQSFDVPSPASSDIPDMEESPSDEPSRPGAIDSTYLNPSANEDFPLGSEKGVPRPQAFEPAYTAHDSGYASMASKHAGHSGDPRDVEFDTRTEYSVESSANVSRQQKYIEELAGHLLNKMPLVAADSVIIEKVFDNLPALLKAFAYKMGTSSQSKIHRDIFIFVHKHRRDIAQAVRYQYFQERDDIADMSSRRAEKMSLGDLMGNWLQFLQAEQEPPSSDEIRNLEEEPLKDMEEEDEVDDEETEVPGLADFRSLVFQSKAYEWLISTLQTEFLLATSEQNLMEDLRTKVISSLPPIHRLSGKRMPERYSAIFHVNWNPLVFITDQEYSHEPGHAIERAITITGSSRDAQALMCKDYICLLWPQTGKHILNLVKTVAIDMQNCRSDAASKLGETWDTYGTARTVTLPDNTIVDAWFKHSKFHFHVLGAPDSIVDVCQQVAWLGAALRTSPIQQGIASCTPFIQDNNAGSDSELVPGISASHRSVFDIDYIIQREEISEKSNGQCWHGLFQNPVVVLGYPILRRSRPDTGLEISLDIMAKLIRARRVTCFDDKLFIKSFSTVLFPTRKDAECIIWHLLFDETDHISFADPRVCRLVCQDQIAVSMADLPNSRHILGWCSSVKSYAGSLHATYEIDWSGLGRPDELSPLRSIVVRNGMLITSSAAAVGKKDIPAYLRPQDGYLSTLKWIEKKFVHLFDVKERRSWLIDGASALLHLVRTSLAHDRNGNFGHLMLFELDDIKEKPQIPNRKAAAIAVLTDAGHKRQKLYHNQDSPENVLALGRNTAQHEEPQNYVILKDRIERICHTLEQILSYQDLLLSGYKGPRGQLEGFDFMDVATDEDPFSSRAAALQPSGKSWVDFVRATYAPTLFGQGFGDILKPADAGGGCCTSWAEMPQGMDLLAVCVSDLKEISKRRGSGASNPYRLVDEIHWHTPDKIFEPCRCEKQDGYNGAHCDRIQVLVPDGIRLLWGAKFTPPDRLTADGAVIFGYSERCPLHWEDYGDPEQAHSWSEPKSFYHPPIADSGIGSSVSSYSTYEGLSAGGRRLGLSREPGPEQPAAPPRFNFSSTTLTSRSSEYGSSVLVPATITETSSLSLNSSEPGQPQSGSEHGRNRHTKETFRVKGIPSEYGVSRLREALGTHPGFETEPKPEIFIKSLAAEAHGRSKVATISFSEIPPMLSTGNSWNLDIDSEGELDLETIDRKKTITIDNHFHGLTILHCPEKDHNVDIIFVSGLGGHAFGSFKQRGGNHMWPLDSLRDDVPMARIILYGYEARLANSTGFQSLADLGNSLQKALQSFT